MTILKNNLKNCMKVSPDYVPEARSELAYASYLSGDFRSAIHHASITSGHFHTQGAIGSLRTSREIIIAANWKLGRRDIANSLSHQLNTDPLGLELGYRE